MKEGEWEATFAFRYQFSNRHYVGDHERKNRIHGHNDVRNRQNIWDLSLTRAMSDRWTFTVSIPLVFNERSQRNNTVQRRIYTHASGLGDIILTPRYWMCDPAGNPRGNTQIGVGLKLPTGEPDATDTFIDSTGNRVIRTVDQSIQPGDGGYGFVVDLFMFYNFKSVTPYLSALYLINPEGSSNVSTYRNASGEQEMSIADAYVARGGFAFPLGFVDGLGMNLGCRIEGIPVYDLVGGNHGFRRPGHAISYDPGFSYTWGAHTASISVPIAFYRNREKSVPDRKRDAHGDAAFADWLLLLSYSIRF